VIEVLQVETEFARLRDLYDEVAPAAVLEIGSYQGGTLREWLTFGDPLRVVAVDIDHVNPDLYEEWRQPHTFLNIVTGESTSDHARAQIEELAPYDWAFIDGDHGEHGVMADTRMVRPLMQHGSYLVYHDIVGDMACPVYAPGLIVDQFESEGYEVTRFVDGGIGHAAHGIGVIRIP